MTDGTDTTETPEPQASGLFDTWLNLYFAPRQAFDAIVARPRVLVPLILILALSLGFTAVWMTHVDPVEFIKAQLQDSGQWDKMPPQARSQAMEFGPKFFKIQAWVVTPIIIVVWYLISALYFLLVCRFFYGASTKFKALLSVTVWANFAYSVLTVPLMLLTLYLKGDWNVNPQEAFQASAAMFLDKAETAKWLWSLAGSLDLITFWLLTLLAIGLSAAMKRKGATIWPVVIPWAIIVIIKVGWTAMMS